MYICILEGYTIQIALEIDAAHNLYHLNTSRGIMNISNVSYNVRYIMLWSLEQYVR